MSDIKAEEILSQKLIEQVRYYVNYICFVKGSVFACFTEKKFRIPSLSHA